MKTFNICHNNKNVPFFPKGFIPNTESFLWLQVCCWTMHELHIFGTNFIMPYIMLLPKPLVFFLLILEYSAETQVGWIRRVKKTQGGLGIKSRWTLLASFSSVNSLIWKKKIEDSARQQLKMVEMSGDRWS